MKTVYDKHVTSHTLAVDDHVMLWDPPHRTGVSRSFQPKWQGLLLNLSVLLTDRLKKKKVSGNTYT